MMASVSYMCDHTGKPAESSQLIAYLLRVVPALLENDEDVFDVVTLQTVLEENNGKLKRFIEDAQEHTLSVFYTSLPPEESDATFIPTFIVQLGVQSQSSSVGAVFTKRAGNIEADKPMRSQLRFLTVAEDSPFETLHAYVQDAIDPYFNSLVRQSGRDESEEDKLVTSVQRNVNELAVALLCLQQNMAIPEISLPIHPLITKAVESAAKANRQPTVEDIGEHLSDAAFLNSLQKQVVLWTKEICKVTTLQRDVSSGTTLQEVNFWLSMKHTLSRVRSKRDSPAVVLTLEALKAGKRFHTALSFDSDTHLNNMEDKVMDYAHLMQDFPITELLAANTLPNITLAIEIIFSHLKKIRCTTYPSERVIALVEAISRDLLTQLLKVLSAHKLMIIAYKEFNAICDSCIQVFVKWEEDFAKFTTQLRDLAKKRRDNYLKFLFKFSFVHKKLESRISEMKKFRHQHEQLLSVISHVLKKPARSLKEQEQTSANTSVVCLAYDSVKVVDCLDLSPDGSSSWDAALERYEERIDKVETRIAGHLRDQLGSTRTANQMFKIFSHYNPLFVRPRIRGAIREHQMQLIQRVKEDIDNLHKKFKMQYNKTHAYAICCMLDIPPISSAIMWARQIEHQLDLYLQRVEAVLGPDWGTHIDGHKLKHDSDLFKLKLNTVPLFEEWMEKMMRFKIPVIQGHIFSIITQSIKGPDAHLKLAVNFDEDVISLYKEVRNLRNMDFRIPFSISQVASQANHQYSNAMYLKESIRTYEQTCQKIANNEIIKPLVARLKIDVQDCIKEGINITWDSYRLESYVDRFTKCVFNFQEEVDEALQLAEQICLLVSELATCEYSTEKFTEILDEVQKLVDDLNLRSYTNLFKWVSVLDTKIEEMLMSRLSDVIIAWKNSLTGHTDTALNAHGGTPEVEAISHELHIANQIMHVEPPLELSRCHLIAELHKWISTITGLQRIQSTRYKIVIEERDSLYQTYRLLLGKMMKDYPQPLVDAYGAIEGLLGKVETYVNEWLKNQSLWNMEFSNIASKLGDNLNMWQHLLLDMKKSRYTINTNETSKQFGPVEIHFGKVQSLVNQKYDTWHKEVLNRFGILIGSHVQESYSTISEACTNFGSTSDKAIQFSPLLEHLNKELESQVEIYYSGQKLLERNRYQFPSISWPDIANEQDSFNGILKKDGTTQTDQGYGVTRVPDKAKLVPDTLKLTYDNEEPQWVLDCNELSHNGEEKKLNFHFKDLQVGQSVELCVTHSGELHCYIDKSVVCTGLPPATSYWGVANAYDQTTQIQLKIYQNTDFQNLREHLADSEREKMELEKELHLVKQDRMSLDTSCSQLQQEKDKLQAKVSQLSRENELEKESYRTSCNEFRQEKDQLQAHVAKLSRENRTLNDQVKELSQQLKATAVNESWKVNYKEVTLSKQELGRGGWGVIWIGEFREQKVAVKQVNELIISPEFLNLLHREINTMAQLRHPNLLQFIGAVLDHPSGNPMIITEIMDISLRDAYKTKQLNPVPVSICLSIMRDVAVGLNYLHYLSDPIIHRDISSANVLLESKGPGKWKTKISDFGSAKLARSAVTKAAGAEIYSAPESFQSVMDFEEEKQTPKMDVYSYGILLCETVTCQFPERSFFRGMLQQVCAQSPPLHGLIVSCLKRDPTDRPAMKQVIQQLDNIEK